MEIKFEDGRLDSTTYRRIFEFFKKEGIEPFAKLLADIQQIEQNHLIENSVFRGKHPTLDLVQNNPAVIEFLRQFEHFLHYSITDKRFREFVVRTAARPNKIDLSLETAQHLEELKVGSIDFISFNEFGFENFNTELYRDKDGQITDIIKYYSNLPIRYSLVKPTSFEILDICEVYDTKTDTASFRRTQPAWILRTENHSNGWQYRHAYLTDDVDFAFDSKRLPSEVELSSYKEPNSLRLYKKGITN